MVVLIVVGVVIVAGFAAAVRSISRRERKLNRPPYETGPDPTQPTDLTGINF